MDEEEEYSRILSNLNTIFSFLDNTDKCQVALVCQLYNMVVTRPSLWTNTCLNASHFNDELEFPARLIMLQSVVIDFSNSDLIYVTKIRNILQNVTDSLVHLVFANISSLTDEIFIDILKNVNLPQLQSLSIISCENISDESVNFITQNVRKNNFLRVLVHLHLRYLPRITSIPNMSTFHTLDLTGCKIVSDDLIQQLISKTPDVTSLLLAQSSRFTIQGLRHLLDFKNIMHLDVSNCALIDDRGVGYIAQMNQLKCLSLSGCYAISDMGLNMLCGNVDLISLDVSECGRISDHGITKLMKMTTLENLDASYLDMITNNTIQVLSSHPNLRHCYVVGCSMINSMAIPESHVKFYMSDSDTLSFISRSLGRDNSMNLMLTHGPKMHYENPTLFDEFDYGTILHIFSYLSFKSVCTWCLVSRKWYTIASNPTLYTKFPLTKIMSDWKIQDWLVSGMFYRYSLISMLNLTYVESNSTSGITELFDSLPELNELSYSGDHNVLENKHMLDRLQTLHLVKMKHGLPNLSLAKQLSTLYMEKTSISRGETMAMILFDIPTLRKLYFVESFLSFDEIETSKHVVSSIELLSFRRMRYCYGLENVVTRLENVTHLEVEATESIKPYLFLNMDLPNLQQVDFLGHDYPFSILVEQYRGAWQRGTITKVRAQQFVKDIEQHLIEGGVDISRITFDDMSALSEKNNKKKCVQENNKKKCITM
jgi:hypothetical protein